MKLIIQDGRIVSTATDHYAPTGAEQAVLDASSDFDISRIAEYRFINGVLTLPAARQLSHIQYMQRFTESELEWLYTAAKANVAFEIWLDKFRLADFIDLDDPDTAGGLDKMVLAGGLEPHRPAEILA